MPHAKLLGPALAIGCALGLFVLLPQGRGVKSESATQPWQLSPEAGLDSSRTPATVRGDFLLAVLSGRARVSPIHPFYGRKVVIWDLRGVEAHRLGRLPFSSPIEPGTLDQPRVQEEIADESTVLVFFGANPQDRTKISALRTRRLYELAEGWESLLEAATTKPVAPPHEGSSSPPPWGGTQALPPPEVPTLTAEALHARLQSGERPTLVFVGPKEKFLEARIAGAQHVPLAKVEEFLSRQSHESEIVFYCGCCSGTIQGLSGVAVQKALAMGFARTAHLEGHLGAWIAAGYAVERGE